jgi:hypothetical protein
MSAAAHALIVVIRLYSAAGIPDDVLATAVETTTDTLRAAQLQVKWIVCARQGAASPEAAACVTPAAASDLIVRIIRTPGPGIAGRTLGHAAVDTGAGRGTLATLYADRIDRLAAGAGVARGLVFGLAMAHEVGHLLLGTTTHPTRGLMRATWASADLRVGTARDWLFSPSEALALRERTAGRPAAEGKRP